MDPTPNRGSPSRQQHPPPGIAGSNVALDQRCREWIKEYQDGKIGKGEAHYKIFAELNSSGADDDAVKAAVNSFVAAIDSYDQRMGAALDRRLGKRERSPSRPGSISRTRSSSTSSESSTEDRKKRKINESELPWAAKDKLLGIVLWPELRETIRLLRKWAKDPKKVKAYLVNSLSCPEFPEAEWLNIILGKAVNLDVIFSGLYSTDNDSRRIEHLGDIELKFGAKDTAKHISSHGDWTIAFDMAKEAYLFAFPHRANEFQKHQRYILQQFASKATSEHARVIALDKAIRKRVSERRNLMLCDTAEFSDLQTIHLDHYGAGPSVAAT